MGKLTISTGPLSMSQTVSHNQAGYHQSRFQGPSGKLMIPSGKLWIPSGKLTFLVNGISSMENFAIFSGAFSDASRNAREKAPRSSCGHLPPGDFTWVVTWVISVRSGLENTKKKNPHNLSH